MRDIGDLSWENENPVVASEFLNIDATFAENESSIEEQCVGVFPEKNSVRLVQKLCSAKSSGGAICKKKGICPKSQLLIEP